MGGGIHREFSGINLVGIWLSHRWISQWLSSLGFLDRRLRFFRSLLGVIFRSVFDV